MKIKRISAGLYKADNGYTIKSNASKNIFTGRPIKADFWYIYDAEGNRVDGDVSYADAKARLEELVNGKEN